MTTVVLGVSGGIAAYKSAELVRLLVKEGIEVHCILTKHALQFITPLTLATLSGNRVLIGNFEASETGKIQHIALAEKADLILIAPATANVLAKLAHGIADDLLTTTALAAQGRVAVCPAMNVFMWENPATAENLHILESRGVEIIGPAKGELACGYEATGRMEEPTMILESVMLLLKRSHLLSGKKVLITAGPTREFFDPVRFISNPSSGKMGYALAHVALQMGAKVTLISGPTELTPPYGATVERVTTAFEMHEAVKRHFPACDFFIASAAVSDWKPKTQLEQKEKKGASSLLVELVTNPDILAEAGTQKKNQILVGFAAETENLEENAVKKLKEKNLDLIVGNLVSKNGKSAFGSDENEITLFFKDGTHQTFSPMSKRRAAYIILEAAAQLKVS